MRIDHLALLAACAVGASACAGAGADPSLTGDYLTGRFAARQNAVETAADAFAEAHKDAPGQPDILRSAFFYKLAAGDVEGAGPLAAEILHNADESDDGLARITLAAIDLKAGDAAAARRRLDGDYDAAFLEAAAYLTDVWVEDALHGPLPALAKLEITPEKLFRGFNPLHKALLSEKAGEVEAARRAHQISVFGFGGPIGRSAYGVFLERIGDEAAAQEYYDLLHREAGVARRMAEAGMSRLGQGRRPGRYENTSPAEGAAIAYYSFAAAILEQTAGERARAEEAGFNVGEPRYNLPLALVQLAIYLDPELHYAHNLAGQIFNVYGDFDAAAASLGAIPPSSPLFEQARIFIAGGVAARGEPEEAIAMLKDTVRRDPLATEARFSLANLYASEERFGEATRELTTIIDGLGAEPEDDAWRFFIARGAALLEMDRWKEAEADLKKAVEIAPEEATTLNYLGYSWAERGENLEEAFDLIEKAVALEPSSGAITDSLGWAHYQRGDYDEAVGHLEKAASMEPSDPTITDHLGDVYWRLGREIEARYQWRRALELEPPEKLREAVERKLERGLEDAGDGE